MNESDYGFVAQAIRDRAESIIKQICVPIDMFAEVDDADIPVIKLDLAPPPQLEEPKPVKDPKAPYGYKKDGTPRARPGRPTKRRVSSKRK